MLGSKFSAATNSHQYLILFFGKWWALIQNGLCFLVLNRIVFCLVCFLPQKQWGMLMRNYHSKTARYGYAILTLTIYKHLDSLGFVSTLCCKKASGWILVSIKSSFYARLLYKCDVMDNFFNHCNKIDFLISNSFPLLHYNDSLCLFAANVFSTQISQKHSNNRSHRAEIFWKRTSQTTLKKFSKKAKVLMLLICNSG